MEVSVGPYPPTTNVENEVCGNLQTYSGKDVFSFPCKPSNGVSTKGQLGRYITAQLLGTSGMLQVTLIEVDGIDVSV